MQSHHVLKGWHRKGRERDEGEGSRVVMFTLVIHQPAHKQAGHLTKSLTNISCGRISAPRIPFGHPSPFSSLSLSLLFSLSLSLSVSLSLSLCLPLSLVQALEKNKSGVLSGIDFEGHASFLPLCLTPVAAFLSDHWTVKQPVFALSVCFHSHRSKAIHQFLQRRREQPVYVPSVLFPHNHRSNTIRE